MEISEIVTINLSVQDIKEIISLHLETKGYHVNNTDFTIKPVADPNDRFSFKLSVLDKATCLCSKI